MVAAGGRVCDAFGSPLAHSRAAVAAGRLLNDLGVVASSARAAGAHAEICAAARADAATLTVLAPWGVAVGAGGAGGGGHAADVARDLDGFPLSGGRLAAVKKENRKGLLKFESVQRRSPNECRRRCHPLP